MKKTFGIFAIVLLLLSCEADGTEASFFYDNPEIPIYIPKGFPELNPSVKANPPTLYGVELGKKLFHDKKLSSNNSISCASCHQQSNAFTDNRPQAIGVHHRIGLRNTPPIQNMSFMRFYNWDGNILLLEKQPLVPIVTHEEMDSSILEIIDKLSNDPDYKKLFVKAFGDEEISPQRIYNSIAQYEYTLISANSKYDRVMRNEGEAFTASELRGYQIFEQKCAACHSTELFTDQSFRNIGFPTNPNPDEAGRGRVTGKPEDYMSFRVPSLRNVEYTAPYGSFGQFSTLKEVLDYFDNGVIDAPNLDPILKENGNSIPLTEGEKEELIAFMKTLSDANFTAIE
ncbi:cytochrome-c peroxidase [Sinomicrobium sp.]